MSKKLVKKLIKKYAKKVVKQVVKKFVKKFVKNFIKKFVKKPQETSRFIHFCQCLQQYRFLEAQLVQQADDELKNQEEK